MATQYILYIHGVNCRKENYSANLSRSISFDINWNFKVVSKLLESSENKPTEAEIEKINICEVELFWGDINENLQKNALKEVRSATSWAQLWYRGFRENFIWPFAGDAILYLSPNGGKMVAEKISEQLLMRLSNFDSQQDCIHLVGHSWGTVIIFDLLFSRRWESFELPGWESVVKLRERLSSEKKDIETNIRIASIHTLGSPISVFSLLDNFDDEKSSLAESLKTSIKRSPLFHWKNYIHPGDVVAWPIEESLTKYVPALLVKDVVLQLQTRKVKAIAYVCSVVIFFVLLLLYAVSDISMFLKHLRLLLIVLIFFCLALYPVIAFIFVCFGLIVNKVSQLIPFLLFTGFHHGSYWNHEVVADSIVNSLQVNAGWILETEANKQNRQFYLEHGIGIFRESSDP